jgi:hypothetical protein
MAMDSTTRSWGRLKRSDQEKHDVDDAPGNVASAGRDDQPTHIKLTLGR